MAAQGEPRAPDAPTTADSDWSRVAAEDGAFRAEENNKPFMHSQEAAALASLFASVQLCAVCEKGLGAKRWGETVDKWGTWRAAAVEAQGQAAESVVVALDAVHLRPTGILKRLEQGVAAACFGLATLMTVRPLCQPRNPRLAHFSPWIPVNLFPA